MLRERKRSGEGKGEEEGREESLLSSFVLDLEGSGDVGEDLRYSPDCCLELRADHDVTGERVGIRRLQGRSARSEEGERGTGSSRSGSLLLRSQESQI